LAVPPPAPIIGSWRIEDVDSGGVIDSSRIEIQFDADGRASGYAGCNAFTGRYTRSGPAIEIGPLASTRRACLAEALSRQEARLLHSLDTATALTWTPDGALILTGPAPSRLVLRRNESAPPAEAATSLPLAGMSPRDALIDCAGAVTAQDGVNPLAGTPSTGSAAENSYFLILALMDKEPGLEGAAGRNAAAVSRDQWRTHGAAERTARAAECASRWPG
jgi:putative lipoprotein